MIFTGRTNQGNYIGTWDTKTGEVAVDIEAGGWSVGGLVDVRKAEKKFHAVGSVTDGKVTAESDGKPLEIVERPTPRK